jgi:hypothetical protein
MRTKADYRSQTRAPFRGTLADHETNQSATQSSNVHRFRMVPLPRAPRYYLSSPWLTIRKVREWLSALFWLRSCDSVKPLTRISDLSGWRGQRGGSRCSTSKRSGRQSGHSRQGLRAIICQARPWLASRGLISAQRTTGDVAPQNRTDSNCGAALRSSRALGTRMRRKHSRHHQTEAGNNPLDILAASVRIMPNLERNTFLLPR